MYNLIMYLLTLILSDLIILEVHKSYIDDYELDNDYESVCVDNNTKDKFDKVVESICRKYYIIDINLSGDEYYNYQKLELVIIELKREEKLKKLGI